MAQMLATSPMVIWTRLRPSGALSSESSDRSAGGRNERESRSDRKCTADGEREPGEKIVAEKDHGVWV